MLHKIATLFLIYINLYLFTKAHDAKIISTSFGDGSVYFSLDENASPNCHFDYKIFKFIVANANSLKIKLAPGGGSVFSVLPLIDAEVQRLKLYKK